MNKRLTDGMKSATGKYSNGGSLPAFVVRYYVRLVCLAVVETLP